MVDSVTSSLSATSVATSSSTTSDALASDFETFLTMMTTQLENQDPLNPVDSSDYSTQLATFSGVEQQVQTNELLTALLSQLGTSGLVDMANLIGMEARSSSPVYFEGNEITVAPSPLDGADQTFLTVRDRDGDVVDRQEISVSGDRVQWDGVSDTGATLPDGLYSFEIESYIDGEQAAVSTADAYSPISEIRDSYGTSMLIMAGGVEVSRDSVTALRDATSG
jgi:flagellar basal-body rod modification protein FlgD